MLVSDGKTKIAQYGQWDGYPGGQGATILSFLKSVDLSALREKVKRIKFIDDNKQKEIDSFLKEIGCPGGWMDMKQYDLYKKRYPLLSRDNGAKILQMVMDSQEDEIWLNDGSGFVNDSLMNEWTYVVDLDKNTFEVYDGFNQAPLDKSERFYAPEPDKDGYYPVKHVVSFDIADLPTEEEFLAKADPEEVEDEN